MAWRDRLAHAWNAFTSDRQNESPVEAFGTYASSFSVRPDRTRSRLSSERSILAAVYTRLSVDVAAVNIRHVRQDDNQRYLETIKSGLNSCFSVEANMDQAATQFRQDIAATLFDKGVIAIVPVDTDINPKLTGGYDIRTLRVGEIVEWYPKHVRVSVWNEDKGARVNIVLPKRLVAIVENPLYSVMNETNSTLQRIISKLRMLDQVDEASSSGKLDLIIQLPYTLKTESRRQQAETRRQDIESQLKGSAYGIAYTEATEKITQLNRPAENNMLKQIEYLMGRLYSELGLAQSIFDGTADEATMLNYYNRTVEPVLTAITEALTRTFLTKTARTQGQTVMFIRDPFKLVPLKTISESADVFIRGEVLSSNEIRALIGFRPSKDPKADLLNNSNMPGNNALAQAPDTSEQDALVNQTLDEIEKAADDVLNAGSKEE